MKQMIVILATLFIVMALSMPISYQESFVIPSWIKNNAKWWSEGQVQDSEFTQGIQYLIEQGIMKISSSSSSLNSANGIPTWVKNNAKWWSEGLLDDSEFVNGIQYLVQSGIIQINPTTKQSPESYQQMSSTSSGNQGPTNGLEMSNKDSPSVLVQQSPTQATGTLYAYLKGESQVTRGNFQYLTVLVTDGTNPVRGATVSFEVDYASSFKTKHFHCTTDSSGKYSYSWMIEDYSTPGIFEVSVNAKKNGYASGHGEFSFEVVPATDAKS